MKKVRKTKKERKKDTSVAFQLNVKTRVKAGAMRK